MKLQKLLVAIAAGVGTGAAFYVLGAVGGAVVAGVSAPVLAAVGFSVAFVVAVAGEEKQ